MCGRNRNSLKLIDKLDVVFGFVAAFRKQLLFCGSLDFCCCVTSSVVLVSAGIELRLFFFFVCVCLLMCMA